ncbi:MAG: UDP-N-acetylglucosamine 2-epimerase (non-hydrolyzing) [Chloroflexi bacterium]|nr:UDP-N-acetylglucosamine 2-epimerase (non-hydrolyzing) [Chloroflexota bacterium]
MKLIHIVGARPQFIKTAVVYRAIKVHNEDGEALSIQARILHTGQHYDDKMSEIFFRELAIPKPDYNLGIGGGTHGQNTGRMLEAIEQTLFREKPDWVLVYGDTDSTLAGTLAAVKLHISVAHVEAGLRSFNRQMPEEVNRVLVDHAADILFVPTEIAVENLLHEGIPGERVHLVGDVMYDAALYYGGRADRESHVLERLGLLCKDYVLATVHRAENTDAPARLQAIVEGLSSVAREMPVVLPLHPRTKKALARYGLLEQVRPLRIIDPVGYLDMVMLEKNANLIATDSGGVQKEAFFHRVPCVTMRDETEWVELVDWEWNRLVPPERAGAISEAIFEQMNVLGREVDAYGGGKAAMRIASVFSEVA